MQTKAKVNSMVTHRFIDEHTLGFTVAGLPEMRLDVTKAHQDNRIRAEFHGWIQRVTDMAAVPVADKDGNIVPKSERLRVKHERMGAVIAHFESGAATWTTRQAAVTRGSDHVLTIRAMIELFRTDGAGVEKRLDSWVQNGHGTRGAILDSFAGREDISELVRGYRAESVKGIDTDSLMEEGLGEE